MNAQDAFRQGRRIARESVYRPGVSPVADLPVKAVEVSGRDNQTFRLGEDMSVRLPSAEEYVLQVDKEHRWLPRLMPLLRLPIRASLAKRDPAEGYPDPDPSTRGSEVRPQLWSVSPTRASSPPRWQSYTSPYGGGHLEGDDVSLPGTRRHATGQCCPAPEDKPGSRIRRRESARWTHSC
jgi:hypothetical protein